MLLSTTEQRLGIAQRLARRFRDVAHGYSAAVEFLTPSMSVVLADPCLRHHRSDLVAFGPRPGETGSFHKLRAA
jgi:hypothetical protein